MLFPFQWQDIPNVKGCANFMMLNVDGAILEMMFDMILNS